MRIVVWNRIAVCAVIRSLRERYNTDKTCLIIAFLASYTFMPCFSSVQCLRGDSKGSKMERTWLDALPQHSIFSNSNSSNTQDSLHSEQLLPPSPGLSTVASFTGDDSTLNLHASTSLAGNGAAAASSTSNPKGKRRATCVVRKAELLVAVGSSIRLGDLAHFKTRVEASTAAAGSWNDENASNVDDTTTDYAPGSSTLGSFKVRLALFLQIRPCHADQ